jgi:hypothetical protein
MLVLFSSAIAIVLYIGNVIAVGNLLAEVDNLENRHRQILLDKERLQFQVRQLSSLERIQGRAEAELGLKVLRDPPTWISVDGDKIRELEEASTRRSR